MSAQVLDLSFYQSEQCREKILDAAFQLYARGERGPVTLSEVAGAAELPAAVVAWHFGSEAELSRQILQRFFHWLLPRVLLSSQQRLRQARRSYSTEQILRAFFSVLSRMLQRYEGLFSRDLQAPFAAGLGGREPTLFFELMDEFTPELLDTIRAGQTGGRFDPGLDSGTVATLLKSLVNGGAVQCVMFPADEDPSYYFDRLCDQALDLLLAEPEDWKRWAE